MFTNTKIVLAAVLLLIGTSAVLANDIDESASPAQVERDWQGYLNSTHMGRPAYGYFLAPSQDSIDRSRRLDRSR